MPCNCDHLKSSQLELELSRVLLLLRELDTGVPVDPTSGDWNGYLSGAYNGTNLRRRTDAATAELCSRLKGVDVAKYSLELQVWWRDHQAADRAKEERK